MASMSDGLRPVCVICWSARHHGLTRDQYFEIIDRQQNLCGLCEEPLEGRTTIDHDHNCCTYDDNKSCGKCVRGVIHFRCNISLISVEKDSKFGKKAMKYLQKNSAMDIDESWIL